MVGPPYRVAVRLYAVAAEKWPDIDGEAAFKGVDLLVLPPDRFLSALLFWLRHHVEDWSRFEYALYEPVAGRVSETDVNDELQQFGDFMTAFGG